MIEIFKENRVRVPYGQLKDLYKGKWLFLVNLQNVYTQNEDGEFIPNELNACEILVVADEPYEGRETGIYKEAFDANSEYGMTGEMDLSWKYPPNTNQVLVKGATLLE